MVRYLVLVVSLIVALCVTPFLWLVLALLFLYRCAAILLAGRRYTFLSRVNAVCGQELESPNCTVNLVFCLKGRNIDANANFNRFWEKVVMADSEDHGSTGTKRFPNFSRRLAFKYGYLTWRDVTVSEMDQSQHLYEHPGEPVGSEEELQSVVNWYFNRLLPSDRPPWELVLVQLREGWRQPRHADDTVPDALWLWRVNHSVIDGLSLLRIMSEVLATNREVAKGALLRTIGPLPDWARLPDSLAGRCKWWLRGLLYVPMYGLKGVCGKDSGFLQDRVVTHRKNFVWSAPIPMSRVRAVKRAASAGRRDGFTVNDVVMSCVAGALGTFIKSQFTGQVPNRLTVYVPVSHQELDGHVADGNYVMSLVAKLPTDQADPRQRLDATKKVADALKKKARSGVDHFTIWMAGRLFTRRLISLCHHMMSGSASFSNMAAPPLPVDLIGCSTVGCFCFSPNTFLTGLSLAITSHCDSFVITVVMDTGIDEQVEAAKGLVKMVEEELNLLEQSFVLPPRDFSQNHEAKDEESNAFLNLTPTITSTFDSITTIDVA